MERLMKICIPPGMRYVISLTPRADGKRTTAPAEAMKRVARELAEE